MDGEGQGTPVKRIQREKEPNRENPTICRVGDVNDSMYSDNSGTRRNLTGGGELSALETTMAWSPEKKTGLKRNIEAIESEEEREPGSEEEEGELESRLPNKSKEVEEGSCQGKEAAGVENMSVTAPEGQ